MRQLLFRLRFQLVRQELPVQHSLMIEDRVGIQFHRETRRGVRRRPFAAGSARHAVTFCEAPALTSLAVSATMRQTFQLGTIRARSIRHHNEQPVPSGCLGPSSSELTLGTRMREIHGHSFALPVRHRMARSPSSSGMKDRPAVTRRMRTRSTTQRRVWPAKRDSLSTPDPSATSKASISSSARPPMPRHMVIIRNGKLWRRSRPCRA